MYIYNADLKILKTQFSNIVKKYLPDTVISVISPVELNEITLMLFINIELKKHLEGKQSEGFCFYSSSDQCTFNTRIENETNIEFLEINNFRIVDKVSKWSIEAKAINTFLWMGLTHTDGWEQLAPDNFRIYAEIQTSNIQTKEANDFDYAMSLSCVLELDPITKKVTADITEGIEVKSLFEFQDAQDYLSDLLSVIFGIENFREYPIDIYPDLEQIGNFTSANLI